MIFNVYRLNYCSPHKRIIKMPMMKMMYTSTNNTRKVVFLLAFMLSVIYLKASPDSLYTVDGTVLSGSGRPVADVTISIEGSADLPFVTGESGTFTLHAPSGDSWVIVSPIRDFKEQRIFLNNRASLTIYLTPVDIASGYDELEILSHNLNKRNIVASFDNLDIQNIHHTPQCKRFFWLMYAVLERLSYVANEICEQHHYPTCCHEYPCEVFGDLDACLLVCQENQGRDHPCCRCSPESSS